MTYNFIVLKEILKSYQTKFPIKCYFYGGKLSNKGVAELSVQRR